MGACHRRPLSLLSVRRGWAIGRPVIVDEAVGMELRIQPPGMMFVKKLATFRPLEYTHSYKTSITFHT